MCACLMLNMYKFFNIFLEDTVNTKRLLISVVRYKTLNWGKKGRFDVMAKIAEKALKYIKII